MHKDGVDWNGKEIFAEILDALDVVSEEVAKKVANDAKRLCPVGTGALRNSIKVTKSKFKGGGFAVAAGGGDIYYAGMVELGTSRAEKKSFLRPAKHNNESFAERKFKGVFKE